MIVCLPFCLAVMLRTGSTPTLSSAARMNLPSGPVDERVASTGERRRRAHTTASMRSPFSSSTEYRSRSPGLANTPSTAIPSGPGEPSSWGARALSLGSTSRRVGSEDARSTSGARLASGHQVTAPAGAAPVANSSSRAQGVAEASGPPGPRSIRGAAASPGSDGTARSDVASGWGPASTCKR